MQPDAAAPGFQRIIIKPAIVAKPEKVDAWHQTPYGRLAVRREVGQGTFTLSVEVPPNATAEVHIPADNVADIREGGKSVRDLAEIKLLRQEGNTAVFEIGSGRYEFTAPMK
jgi:alpha-L-rhamnosidase